MIGYVEAVFLMGFAYWIWPDLFFRGASRLNKMMDIVTNRFFDAFNKFSPRDGHFENRQTVGNLQRFSADQKRNRTINREADNKAREADLYDVKEKIPNIVDHPARPFMGLSCYNCAPTSRETLVYKTTKYLGLKNLLKEYPLIERKTFWEQHFPCLAQVCKSTAHFVDISHSLLDEPRVKNAIEKTAIQQFQDSDSNEDEYYNQLFKNCQKRAKKILSDMKSTPSVLTFRIISWLVYNLFPRFLSSICVHKGQTDMIKEAQSRGLPLIFISLHRSHVDYGVMPFCFLNNGIQVPLVVSGDNLRVPVFGAILRRLGAFFIKRRINPVMGRKDHLYKAILHTYVNASLKTGNNILFFLEGGRTRTGKPLMPKYGIFSIIVDSLMSGAIEDALLVPISINYDRLVDGNFVSEQLGEPKRMESFAYILRNLWATLNKNCGYSRLQINQPISLQEMIKNLTMHETPVVPRERKLVSHTSTTSLYGTEIVSEENKQLVERLSKHILYDCANSTPIMSTNAVAFLLMYRYRNGATLEDLAAGLDHFRQELTTLNRDVGFSGDSVDVIIHALEILGPALVKTEKVNQQEIIKAITMIPNVIELAYYSNTLVTCYALPSVIAVAIKSLTKDTSIVLFDDVLGASKDLCEMLQYEFIFAKPCDELDGVITNAIEDFHDRGILTSMRGEQNPMLRHLAEEIDGLDEDMGGLKYLFNADCVNAYTNLECIVMPLIEAYAVTAFSLRKLIGRTLLEKEFIDAVVAEMKLRINAGSIRYEESVSSDSIRNALKVFQKWGIIESHIEDKIKVYYLHETHDDDESVDNICFKIDCFRRIKVAKK